MSNPETKKRCRICKQMKLLDEFPCRKTSDDGRRSECRMCENSRRKQYYKTHPEKEKFRHVWDHYRITHAEYDALLKAQAGVCAICGQPETSRHKGKLRYLAVDHDHSTKQVRGLLCFRCNTAIGKLGDDPSLVHQAYRYLMFWKSTKESEMK